MSTLRSSVGRLRGPRRVAPAALDGTPRRGARRVARLEAIGLIALGSLLTAGVVGDLIRRYHIDQRVFVDTRTFRHSIPVSKKRVQVNPGRRSTRDSVCAHIHLALPYRVCAIITGPVNVPLRNIVGGYRLPAKAPDKYRYRYACTGVARSQGLCGAPGLVAYTAP